MAHPRITAVTALSGYRLRVSWEDGRDSVVDVSDFVSRFVVFAPLRDDPAAFGKVRVGDWGWSVHWTDLMELPADTLWERSQALAAE
ncbi:MAG: hypothetical protein RLY86_2075 [Pseudomonadota bacterium]|jgi:hypothetical protein